MDTDTWKEIDEACCECGKPLNGSACKDRPLCLVDGQTYCTDCGAKWFDKNDAGDLIRPKPRLYRDTLNSSTMYLQYCPPMYYTSVRKLIEGKGWNGIGDDEILVRRDSSGNWNVYGRMRNFDKIEHFGWVSEPREEDLQYLEDRSKVAGVILFYVRAQDLPESSVNTFTAWDEVEWALDHKRPLIRTTQMGFLDSRLFDRNYMIMVVDEHGPYEIKLGENERTGRLIRRGHDLFRLWKHGEFDKNEEVKE